MKSINLSVALFVFAFSIMGPTTVANASETVSQYITLESGWNIVSTPKVLDSHTFSVDETSENFDIYLLDASQSTGWATMADLGQSEFEPLYGYFVNNKTGLQQTLTFNYDTSVEPNDKLFERTFSSTGWYSIGVANSEYAKTQGENRTDNDNPSRILSLLEGKYDLIIDFTDSVYDSVRKSVALSDPWKAVAPIDINSLNDLRETKGYVMYIKEAGSKYIGFQNDAVVGEEVSDKVSVVTSSNDPDTSTLQVEEDSKSDWHTVFTFGLEAINDITFNSVQLEIELSSSTYEAIADDVEIVIGGNTVDDVVVTNGTSSVATLTFNTAGIVVSSGETAEVVLMLRFKSLKTGDEGVTVKGRMLAASEENVQAVGEDGALINSQLFGGEINGDAHTLRTAGADVTVESTDADVTTNDGSLDDYATFEIEIEVTAFEQDVYIATNPVTSIVYTLQDGAGSTTIAGTRSVVLTSTADETGSYFEVNEGSTESFTLHVTYQPGVSSTVARMVLNSVSFASTAIAPTHTQLTLPATDYRTNVITIVN